MPYGGSLAFSLSLTLSFLSAKSKTSSSITNLLAFFSVFPVVSHFLQPLIHPIFSGKLPLVSNQLLYFTCNIQSDLFLFSFFVLKFFGFWVIFTFSDSVFLLFCFGFSSLFLSSALVIGSSDFEGKELKVTLGFNLTLFAQ